ncbi:MAG: polysaccharide biosynthesis protein [Phycisphaeraceae bacterium]|nr:polysaccharide biosynthesis protein [Phycisphaeraceae bacterium]
MLPRTGVLLVGTEATIASLRLQLGHLDPEPVVAGCVPIGVDGHTEIAGLPALGRLEDLPSIHARYRLTVALICLPGMTQELETRLRGVFRTIGVDIKVVPALEEILRAAGPRAVADGGGPGEGGGPPGAATTDRARRYRPPPPLDLAKLVGREPYGLDEQSVRRTLAGKRILITGAGGSIGSHLARVAAAFEPSQLVLMERAENALFEIDRTMGERHPNVPRRAVLHDVVDEAGTRRLLSEIRPEVVFHAAAHKHVPLMEDHPGHAVTNNLFGTKSIADAAAEVGTERFVMISSDKAVNPRSVMGATKRLAEIYVRSLAAGRAGPKPTGRFSMVRFGNVLGSACSVLNIWATQLAEGGPLTVTDPRMTRYFMTIPEAATLVIQSAAIDHDPLLAPVYVLDMGAPISIVDLARRYIRASGLVPQVHGDSEVTDPGEVVEVVFTGTRPGEKLHEELAYAAEALQRTQYPGINTWAGPAPEASGGLDADSAMIDELSAVRTCSDRAEVLAAIRRYIPGLPGGQ